MESSFAAYAKSVEAAGYQVREQEAIQLFQNADFVKDLNQILQNQYFGTNKPVNPATEKAVKAEMVETMRAMNQISKSNMEDIKEDTKMSFDYKPVSLEEYNQSLRDSVNAYYTHAINDPSMSREDALKSTGEMAEKYLEAVEEFQEAQNSVVAQDNTAVEQESVEDSSVNSDGPSEGEGCDGGIDT